MTLRANLRPNDVHLDIYMPNSKKSRGEFLYGFVPTSKNDMSKQFRIQQTHALIPACQMAAFLNLAA